MAATPPYHCDANYAYCYCYTGNCNHYCCFYYGYYYSSFCSCGRSYFKWA